MKPKQSAFVAITVAMVGGGGLAVAFFSTASDMGKLYREGAGPECGPKSYITAPHNSCGRVYAPIKSMGYSRGHKNNFCIGQGWVGHDSAKPNGHCFRYKSCPVPSNGVAEWKTCRDQRFGEEPYPTKLQKFFESVGLNNVIG